MNLFNKAVVGAMPIIPKNIVGKIAARYVAGEKLDDAVKTVKALNEQGAMTTLDILGEHNKDERIVRETVDSYKEILDRIASENLDSNISVKPTALGILVGYEFCKECIGEIVQYAAQRNNYVRIDMEDHPFTDATLKMYFELHKDYPNVGVVIQAYMRRTIKDVQWLKKMGANIRLCKGIYNEPRPIAYKNREIIIRNYAFLLEEMLAKGCYVGIATYCEESVWHAMKIIHDLGLERDKYEFQMLLGVDPELREIIINAGHRMRVYVPFGSEWYPYSTRRLTENPQLAGSVAKNFLNLSKPGA